MIEEKFSDRVSINHIITYRVSGNNYSSAIYKFQYMNIKYIKSISKLRSRSRLTLSIDSNKPFLFSDSKMANKFSSRSYPMMSSRLSHI